MFQPSRLPILLLITYGLLMILGGHWVWKISHQSLLEDHQSKLDRFSVHIASQLDKFAHIPELLSKDKELIQALHAPDNSAQIELTNRYLAHVNQVIQASDTYLLDHIGTTIAASNWNQSHSFVGRNFAFRPYFQHAFSGKENQYFALGSTSGKRGYYYSYPVSYAAEIIGVIVVKMDLSLIEASWKRICRELEALATSSSRFLFGDRISLADLGFYGQLKVMSVDPTPMAWLRTETPYLYRWLDHADDASGIDGEWVADTGPVVKNLLRIAGDTYLPFLDANASALDAGEDTFSLEIEGGTYAQGVFKYQAKCLHSLRSSWGELTTEDQDALSSMIGTGSHILSAVR